MTPRRDYAALPYSPPPSPPPRSTSPPSTSYPPPRPTALERLAASHKGKGRALPDALDSDAGEEGKGGMCFSLRFTEGEGDLVDLWVGERETVREVKQRVRFLRPSLSIDGRPRRLRLIQLGRLLTDGTLLVPYTVSLLSRRAKLVQQQSEATRDALFAGALEGLEAVGREMGVNVVGRGEGEGEGKGKGKGKEGEEDDRVWLHCSIGDAMEDEEIEGERLQTTQIVPLQGFDRLRDAGFSDGEIANMREEFRANSAGAPANGDEDEHARALEDQWMEGGAQNDIPSETNTGIYANLLQGVAVGFFFPFVVLFFFRTSVFSKRMQMATVLGCCINVAFGLLRQFN